jgi:hypothetical protein
VHLSERRATDGIIRSLLRVGVVWCADPTCEKCAALIAARVEARILKNEEM